ncbi:hypothetical protein ABZ897_19655 [Nonomuraea sp. NPDC046802]|uniref:hypothetical protein n=1 Tax=Nonomuraea sp. NPDC046802 TaxID=3154919 RepID=UPI0033D74C9A
MTPRPRPAVTGPLAVLLLALLLAALAALTMSTIFAVAPSPAEGERGAVGIPGGVDPQVLKTVPWRQGVDPTLPHTLVVGEDIDPGTYTTYGREAGDPNLTCTWARVRGLSGRRSDVIASGTYTGTPMTVTIEPTDKGFVTGGCTEWVPR